MPERQKYESELESLSERESWREYELKEELAYFDKEGHLMRSISHQKNHIRAIKKKKLPYDISKVPS